MIYDIGKVAEIIGVSKVTIYRKLKLQEITPFIIVKNGKQFISEEGLIELKEMLNVTSSETTENNEETDEVAVSTDLLTAKNDLIDSLKEQLSLVKDQLSIKDNQIENKDRQLESKDRLLENMQVLLKQGKEQQLPQLMATQDERDIRLVNTLLDALEQRKAVLKEEESNTSKGFFGFFKRK